MDKRIRSMLIIEYLIALMLTSVLSVALAIINMPQPWIFVILGFIVITGSITLYQLTRAVVRVENSYKRAEYSAMIDSMTGGIIIFDGNARVYTVSDDASRYLGLPEYAVGMYKTDAIKDEELLRCIALAERGESSITEYTVDGVTLRVLVDPVIFSGQIAGTMMLLLDMGEQLTLQRMRREFAANVSHELKTPLTSISGYAEMIAMGIANKQDIPVFAERIHRESNRMLALISDIIRLSSLDESSAESEKELVNIADVVDECRDVLLKSAEDHGVSLNTDTEELNVTGSRSLLSELVYNLMDNAIRYNREGGSVFVEIRGKTLTVRDTGIGIPKEHRAHVFERFYRVDKSRSRQTGGTGLGLAIVKHIAEKYGAEIQLESRENEGTSISVTFRETPKNPENA